MFERHLLPALLVTSFAALPAFADERPILGYEHFGSGSEKVIVLHDWFGNSGNYESVRPWLDGSGFSYVFADIRGYGQSKGLAGDYNSDEIAADIARLAGHLGWEKYHLVGHSMTAMASFKVVMREWSGAKRIKSFVAVTPVTPDGYPASEEDEAFLTATITDDETAGAAYGALTGGKLNAAWAVRKTARTRTNTRPDVLKKYYDMWIGEDFSVELANAKVETPTLVIGGRQDLPGFQQEYYDKTIATWVPAATFTYIENAGHYPT